ncbi:MAG: TolC family protein [Desulfitobacterium sp.]
MKKALSFVLMLTLLLASTSTTHAALAAEDSLDIEKAAIQTIQNSQLLKTNSLGIAKLETTYANTKGALRQSLGYIPYVPAPFQIVKSYLLTPQMLEANLTQYYNGHAMLTNTVRLSAYRQYADLLKANYAVNIQSELMNSLYEDYKKARIEKEKGIVTEAQLRLAEIAYEQTRYRYLSAQNNKDSAYLALNNSMGEALDRKYATLQDHNIKPSAQIRNPEEYMSQALANRAEVGNAQSNLDLLEEQYRYGQIDKPTDFEFYTVEQEQKIAEAKNNLELARIDVQQNIVELYGYLESSMKAMEAMQYLAQQGEQNYQAAQIRYANDEITFVDLNNVKIAKAQADINYKNAEIDAWLMQTTISLACDAGLYTER